MKSFHYFYTCKSTYSNVKCEICSKVKKSFEENVESIQNLR